MKCSIIMAVLDSHEIFRRQMLRFARIVPPDFEVIVLDDGSDIPLRYDGPVRFAFKLAHTNDRRPWTNHLARNRGAALASGEYLLMMDVDHVLTRQIIDRVRRFRGDMLKFHRQVADLDEHGEVRNPRKVLSSPPNIFAIRKTLFGRMGGYDREYVGYVTDRSFRAKYQALVEQGRARPSEVAETIYVVTERKWFHNLKRLPAGPAGAAEIPGVPRELLGDWRSFQLKDWKEAGNHKFLNRNANLEVHWRRLHELLPEYLTPDRRRRFLEVGCGNGASMEVLRHLGHDAEGLDFTPGLSDADRTDWVYRPFIESQRLKCTVHDGAAVPYPFPDDRFEVVSCYGVITCFQPCSLWPRLLDEFARLATSCILLGVNVGSRYDRGKALIDRWRHPKFELAHHEGAVYKWRRKGMGAESAADRRREGARTRLPLVFSRSPVRPVDP